MAPACRRGSRKGGKKGMSRPFKVMTWKLNLIPVSDASLARALSYDHSELQRRLGNVVFIFTQPTSLVAQTVKWLSTMRETRFRSLGREDPLEKEMAIHSSTSAWKIPWTEERSRLQSTGSQRVGLD